MLPEDIFLKIQRKAKIRQYELIKEKKTYVYLGNISLVHRIVHFKFEYIYKAHLLFS